MPVAEKGADNSAVSFAELLTMAEVIILGGRADSPVQNNKKKSCDTDLEQADNLLATLERMIEKFPTENFNATAAVSEKPSSTATLSRIRDTKLLRCQVDGQKGNYQAVVEAADEVLLALKHLWGRNFSSNQDNSELNNIRNEKSKASALGYKGFALMKQRRYSDALPLLEDSMNIRTKIKSTFLGSSEVKRRSKITYAERRERHEAGTIENALALCYQRVGKEPPLPPLVKFPRTPHLFDAGGTAVTSDDLVLSEDDAVLTTVCDGTHTIIIEEKIDGTNMGLSICPLSGRILVQSRSHFVSCEEHAQFNQLENWIREHREALLRVLASRNGNSRGKKFILYGEWMAAKHSVPYDKLPGYFIAFDIYDQVEERFLSRTRFHNVMRGTGIPVVPVISAQTYGPYVVRTTGTKKVPPITSFFDEIRAMLNTRSVFRSDGGMVEGIILRVDDYETINDNVIVSDSASVSSPRWLAHRWKVVRPDFIQGCANGRHWSTRHSTEKQRIDFNYAASYTSDCYVFAQSVKKTDFRHQNGSFLNCSEHGGESKLTREVSQESTLPLARESGETINPCFREKEEDKNITSNANDKSFSLPSLSTEDNPGINTTAAVAVSAKRVSREEREYQKARARARGRVPRFVMLMGLPGSGKSTFASRLAAGSISSVLTSGDEKGKEFKNGSLQKSSTQCLKEQGQKWLIANQDKLGRKECLALAGRASRKNRIILDRCNLTETERFEWIGVLHSPPPGEVALVYFVADEDTCVARVRSRTNHETIPEGRGERIVRDLSNKVEVPTEKEKKEIFGVVEVVRSFEESDGLLHRWGVD